MLSHILRVLLWPTPYFSNTARSLPVAVASCAVLGAAVGVYDSAGKLAGEKRERDTLETWEERRRKFFKQKSSDSTDA